MSFQDPGRIPFRQLMRDAQRQARASEARAELHAQVEAEKKARGRSGHGLRWLLDRLQGRRR